MDRIAYLGIGARFCEGLQKDGCCNAKEQLQARVLPLQVIRIQLKPPAYSFGPKYGITTAAYRFAYQQN